MYVFGVQIRLRQTETQSKRKANVYGDVSPNNSCEACYLLHKLANQLLAKHQTKQKAQWSCHIPPSKYFIYLVVFFWVLTTPKTQMSLHFLPSFLCLPHAQFYWFICSQYCVSQSLNIQTAKLYIRYINQSISTIMCQKCQSVNHTGDNKKTVWVITA